MTDQVVDLMCNAAAVISIVLMAVCGVRLLLQFVRVLRGQDAADGAGGRRRRYAPGRELAMVFALALLSRVLVYLFAYAMHRAGGGTGGFFETLRPLWSHWDTRHYIGIAEHGYVNTGDERLQIVFFPLFPMVMRLLSPLTGGSVFHAGMLASVLFGSGAAALLYDLAYMHLDRRGAALSAAYFLLSPMSVFLNCCYTESLFIFLTLGAMCLLRRGRPWLAALCGMGCALTRMPGVIVAGLMIIALLAKIPKRRFTARAALACAGQVLLVFAGLFIYWAINYAVTGDPMRYMTYQRENWHQRPGSFWYSVSNTVYYLTMGPLSADWFFSWFSQLIAMFFVFIMLAWGVGKLPFDLMAYSFVYTAVVLSPTWLLSGPRYLYALVPLHMLKAAASRKGWAHALGLAVSAALLVLYIYGYAIAIEVL
ncbi:MAG: hypothetical protein J6K32_07090 [Clostridia bacterium]|nr:hypothetical protein [Clostridia bacterium]